MKKEAKIEIVKTVAGLMASIGGGLIVGNAVKMTTPSDINTFKRICIGVGSLALSDIASTAASNQIEYQIDSAVALIEPTIEKIEKLSELVEEEAE